MYSMGYGTPGRTEIVKCEGLEKTGLLRHAYSTRRGGRSRGQFESLNLGLHVGDDVSDVVENRRTLCSEVGIDLSSAVFAQQVHGKVTAVVTSNDRGRGVCELRDAIRDTDCMCTVDKDVALAVMYADCTPVIVLDPLTPALGVAHAGWKGTALGAVGELVHTMHEAFGTLPESCMASIGPCIGKCCYIVDERVYEEFRANERELDGVFERLEEDSSHFRLSLKDSNRLQLLASGLLDQNIFTYPECCRCRSDMFFSSRASGGDTGRCAAIAMLV